MGFCSLVILAHLIEHSYCYVAWLVVIDTEHFCLKGYRINDVTPFVDKYLYMDTVLIRLIVFSMNQM